MRGTAVRSKAERGRGVIGCGLISLALTAIVFGLAAIPAEAGCGSSPGAKVDWTECSKPQLMLQDEDLSGAVFTRAVMSSTSFSKSKLVGARFEGTDVSFSRFDGADLTGTDFTKAIGWRTDFRGANLEKAKLASAELNRSNFTKARLLGATMAKADLNRANLSGAELTGVDLSKAELARVNFREARIGGVRFSYSNLARADLSKLDMAGVDLAGAYLFQTQIAGADLSKATGLRQDQLDLACGSADTRLPQGLARPKGWPCQAED